MLGLEKKLRMFSALPLMAIVALFAMVGQLSAEIRAFYGDPKLNRVVAVDVESMSLAGTIPTLGAVPYPADRAGNFDKVYAITRGAQWVEIINAESLTHEGLLPLEHKPRSAEAYNPRLGLQLIAGGDKPMTSIVNPATDEVVATAGDDMMTTPGDYGGSLSSGHPFWLTKKKFVVIDRANRLIHLYEIKKRGKKGWKVKYRSTVETPTSVHHFVHREGGKGKDRKLFYALAEGNPADEIAPYLLELQLKGNTLKLKRKAYLDVLNTGIGGVHHGDIHPDGVHIYVGKSDGYCYVINRHTMGVVSIIETGLGHGHTRFIPERNLAVTTNHSDTYVSILDTTSHTLITNITVSEPQQNGQKLQSHTNYVSEDGRYYYAFASDAGRFFELDLETLTITRTLQTGGTPIQGTFINLED